MTHVWRDAYAFRFGEQHNTPTDYWDTQKIGRKFSETSYDANSLCLSKLNFNWMRRGKNMCRAVASQRSVSALQSVLPIGVWRLQRCYYVTTTPWRCRHFHSALLRTARQSCGQGSLAMGGKIPKKAFSRLSHTLYIRYHSAAWVYVLFSWRIFVNSSKAAELVGLIGLAVVGTNGLWMCSRRSAMALILGSHPGPTTRNVPVWHS